MRSESEEDRIECEAAQWVARRAAGWSEEESRRFEEWLARDPRHKEWVGRHEETRSSLAGLFDLVLASDGEPDPDFFAPLPETAQPKRWVRFASLAALAACLALVALFVSRKWQGFPGADGESQRYWLSSFELERHFAPDGSLIELPRGSAIEVIFSEDTRRVRLHQGEAHFSVTKDASRPFVVEADQARFQALGTAFNVRLKEEQVELLVTEGVVRVEIAPAAAGKSAEEAKGRAAEQVFERLGASYKAVIPRARGEQEPRAKRVSSEELDRALLWKRETLQFEATSLSEAVRSFNLRNRDQIVIADPELASERIDGVFRSDNVKGFVTLLEVSGDIDASRDEMGRVILRSK